MQAATEQPSSIVVLYDEGCYLCVDLAAWLARRGRTIRVIPIGSESGSRLLRDLAPTERYAAVHAIDRCGRRYTAGAALPMILAALPGGQPLARIAAALPSLTARAYDIFARHRGLIGGLRQHR